MCLCVFSSDRERSDPAVAVPPGPPHLPRQEPPHPLDWQRLRVPHPPPRGDRQTLGRPQEQASHELRQALPRPPLLLLKGDHGQGPREETHVQVHLRRPQLPAVSWGRSPGCQCQREDGHEHRGLTLLTTYVCVVPCSVVCLCVCVFVFPSACQYNCECVGVFVCLYFPLLVNIIVSVLV